MNFLLSLVNAGDKGAVAETNFEQLDASLAFGLFPSIDLSGNPTVLNGAPVAGTFVTGAFWVDASLAIWLCTAGGTPGTWVLWFNRGNSPMTGNYDDPNGHLTPANTQQTCIYVKDQAVPVKLWAWSVTNQNWFALET